MKRMISLIIACSFALCACNERRETVYVPAPQPVQPQVVYQAPPSNVAADMLVGAALTAALINGQPRPGYVMVNGNVYRDTPAVRTYQKTVIVNKTTVVNQAPKAAPARDEKGRFVSTKTPAPNPAPVATTAPKPNAWANAPTSTGYKSAPAPVTSTPRISASTPARSMSVSSPSRMRK